MFGISGWEVPVLAVVALLVLGPDKLPRYAADAARVIRQIRRMATEARDEVTRDLGPEFRDIDLQDLDPRRFVTRHLFEDDGAPARSESPRGPRAVAPTEPTRSSAAPPPPRPAAGERPPYDADAT